MTDSAGRKDFWDEPNLFMDQVIESLAYRARLGAKVAIWQQVDMPMSKPPYRDLDLIECPKEVGHVEIDGSVVWRPLAAEMHPRDMGEDALWETLADHPAESRYGLLQMATKADYTASVYANRSQDAAHERHNAAAGILSTPHTATASAMEAHQARREGVVFRTIDPPS